MSSKASIAAALPYDRRERIPVGHALAEAGKVREDAVVLLGSPERVTKTGDDLVENEQCAVAMRHIDRCLQIALAGFSAGQLHDDRRRFELRKRRLERGQIVEGDCVTELSV